MAATDLAKNLTLIQAEVHRFLKPLGFRKKGRSHNRPVEDGIIHVINFQMGRFEIGQPPPIPGFRENFYGKFWINLGIFLPCVDAAERLRPTPPFVQEYDCQIRSRLGTLAFGIDPAFEITEDTSTLATTIVTLLDQFGLPFLDQFRNYSEVINYIDTHGSYPEMNANRVNLEAAIICHTIGQPQRSQQHFTRALDPDHKGFCEHVREIANGLGYTV